jgi:hypothetical protein
MKILSKREVTPKSNTAVIIYGKAGLGKTTLCGKGNTLVFDIENGYLRSEATADVTQDITSLAELMDFIKLDKKYNNYVIDSGEYLVQLIGDDAKRDNPRLASASMSLKYYGAVNDAVKDFANFVKKCGKNLCVICHVKENEKAETYMVEPQFGSASNNRIMFASFDLIGLIRQDGKTRVLTFEPSESNICKNSLKIPDTRIAIETNIWDIIATAKDNEIISSLEKSETISELIEKLEKCDNKEFLQIILEEIQKNELNTNVEIRNAYRVASKRINETKVENE